MVRIGQDDLGAGIDHLVHGDPFDGGFGSTEDKVWGFNGAMRGAEATKAGFRLRILVKRSEFKVFVHKLLNKKGAHGPLNFHVIPNLFRDLMRP